MPDKTYYQLLQVDPSADPDVIAAAHRVLAKRLHPETDFTGVDEYRLAELNRALRTLTDPEQRRAYDQRIAAERSDGLVPVGPGNGARPHGQAAPLGRARRQPGYTLADRIQSKDTDRMAAVRVDFGRYEGYTLGQLVRLDPEYLQWLSRHSSGVRYRGAILRLLADRESVRQPLHVSPE